MGERIQVHCRPGRQSDTPDVIELTRDIWEGHDYVPEVWPVWLSDPAGGLIVAEYQGHVIGLGKLSHIADEDWWMQGLRVHPQYQGRGVASQLHVAMLEAWRQMGSGVVRLATSSARLPVHHLCEREGFTKVGEYTTYVAPAILPDSTTAVETPFGLLDEADIPEAVTFARQSATMALCNGLMDMDWEWAPPRPLYLARIVARNHAWWWRDRQALLATYQDEEEGKPPSLVIALLACAEEEVAACLLDVRRLAGGLGLQRAFWMAGFKPELAQPLQAAGFVRDWENVLFVYAKEWAG